MSGSIIGVQEVQRLIEQVGKAPAKVLTAAAKAGANVIRQDAKNKAPVETGLLKRGIRLKAEKRRTGKKVYQIKFVGEGFVKISRNGKRSFYPTSQEYGWKLRNGSKEPGKRFLRNALAGNRGEVEQTILNILGSELRRLGG